MRQHMQFFAISLLLIFSVSCRNILDIRGEGDNNPSGYQSVIIADIPPDSLQLTPFALNKATVNLDTLVLNVSYGGGCEEHEFELYMSPAAFMESFPVQANIYLKHNGNGDACRAYITQDVSFNISGIAESYRSSYFSRAGTVILNVFEYYEDSPDKKMQINYSFL